MKENATIFGHLNEFNSLFSKLASKDLNLDDDEMKTTFLLCSLPSSCNNFYATISNFALGKTLMFNDVTSAMLIEKICT